MSEQSSELHSSDLRPGSSIANRPRSIGIALGRHCIWGLPAGLFMAALGAFGVWVAVAPEYEATHILQANYDFVLSRDFEGSSSGLARNERPLIMSPVVLDDVLADPQLSALPSLSDPNLRERNLRKGLTVTSAGTDDLLLITFRDTDRQSVAKLANAIAASYVRERRRFEEIRLANLEHSLLQPIEQSRRNVEESRRFYQELMKRLSQSRALSKSSDSTHEAEEQNGLQSAMFELENADTVFVKKKLEFESDYYDKLNARLLALRAERGRSASLITRSPAREPHAPIDDLPINRMLLAGGLAFFLPFALAILIELRRN